VNLVDQYRDPTLALLVHLVAEHPRVVELVKEAEILPEEADALPDSAFAWPEKRAFPIHSREHAVLSRVYRTNLADVPPHVDDALKEACDVYGVPDGVFEREKRAATPDDPEDYLLPDDKRLPVRTAAEVRRAEKALLDGYQKLAFEHRAEACKRLVDKAAIHGVALDPLMHKLAGFTVSSTQTVKDWLGARREAAPPTYKEAFQKLADALAGQPAEVRDRAALVRLAEVIGELDKKAGLVRHYDRRLPDPLQTVFNTNKVAGHGVELGGRFVPMQRLAEYPASFYGDVLGDDVVREAADGRGGLDPHKLAMILETLPRDMKLLLSRQMR
jgi:hypothetical protein